MLEALLQSIMPPGFDMQKAMDAVQSVAVKIVETHAAVKSIQATQVELQLKLDRILNLIEGQNNERRSITDTPRITHDNSNNSTGKTIAN